MKSIPTLSLLIFSALVAARPGVMVLADVPNHESAKQLNFVNAEQTQSLEELREKLLNDPLFNISSEASTEEFVSTASNLISRHIGFDNDCDRVFFSVPIAPEATLQQRVKRIDEIATYTNDVSKEFFTKFGGVFKEKLQEIADDENLLKDNETLVNSALNSYVCLLGRLGDKDALAKIHEREVERYQKAIASKDESATKTSANRLLIVDKRHLSLDSLPYINWYALQYTRRLPEEMRAPIVETAEKLAQELKSDPYLVGNCNEVYRIMLKFVDEDLALQYRAKFRQAIDKDAAREAFSRVHGHEIFPNNVLIWREDTLDESIFLTKDFEDANSCRSLQREIKQSLLFIDNAPVPLAVIDDYKNKASVVLTKIALKLEELSKSDKSLRSDAYQALDTLSLTSDSALVLKEAIDGEASKPFDQANEQFLSVARSALMKFELEDAARSENKAVAFKACERFAKYAESNLYAANKVAETVSKLARKKNEIGLELLDFLLDKAKDSKGELGKTTFLLLRAKEEALRPDRSAKDF